MKKKLIGFVTVTKAADILGISVPGIFAANKRGTLPLYEVDGGGHILKLSDVKQYKKNRKVGRPFDKTRKKKSK